MASAICYYIPLGAYHIHGTYSKRVLGVPTVLQGTLSVQYIASGSFEGTTLTDIESIQEQKKYICDLCGA